MAYHVVCGNCKKPWIHPEIEPYDEGMEEINEAVAAIVLDRERLLASRALLKTMLEVGPYMAPTYLLPTSYLPPTSLLPPPSSCPLPPPSNPFPPPARACGQDGMRGRRLFCGNNKGTLYLLNFTDGSIIDELKVRYMAPT